MIPETRLETEKPMNEQDPKTELSGILQPSDSKRVADALIEKIKEADFNLGGAVELALERSLKDGLTCGLGEAIVTVIEGQIRLAAESLLQE